MTGAGCVTGFATGNRVTQRPALLQNRRSHSVARVKMRLDWAVEELFQLYGFKGLRIFLLRVVTFRS
jgi:hypothetical protein